MKHNLKELDQFFDAARQGSPLMDDDAFASIIAKADAALPTEVIKQSPTSRIMSAFKHQGGMTMTGLGLTALSGLLVTGYYLNTEAPDQKPAQQVASVAAIAPTVEAVASSTESTAPLPPLASIAPKPQYDLVSVKASLSPETDPNTFRQPISVDSLWARITPESIKPLEITAKEIEELGINDGGDGKVYVVHELSAKGPRMRMAFPPEGLSLHIGPDVEGSISHTTEQIRPDNAPLPPQRITPIDASIKPTDKIAPIMPTMVTDAKGKKLAFFFKAGKRSNGIDVQSMSLSQRSGDETDLPMPFDGNAGLSVGNNSINIQQMTINDDGGITIGGDHDDDEFDIDDDIDIDEDYDITVDGDKQQMTLLRDLPRGMKIQVESQVDLDSVISMNGGNGMARMMVMSDHDSAFKGKMNFNFNFKFDSSNFVLDAQAMRQRMQGMENHAMHLRMNVDSLRATIMKGIDGMNLDSLSKDLRHLRDNIRVRNIESLQHVPSQIELPMIQADRINKLIPVRIKSIDPSAANNQDGLIFWYARDARFAEKAPASLIEKLDKPEPVVADNAKDTKASISKTSAVSEPMVYPNPSPGRTMFKYTLAEPRAVSIAIHDLLGKQVLKVSGLEMKTAGTFEKELDLSSLEAGVYLLIMVTDASEQITQRVVLEK